MRIAIVNDSEMAVEALRRILAQVTHYELAWVAHTGVEAVLRCAAHTPDLVLMDLYMPEMDGVEATRSIMERNPCAILVVTATVEGHAAKTFEALGAGALAAVGTPVLGPDGDSVGADALLEKIRTIGRLVGVRPGGKPGLRATDFKAARSPSTPECLVVLGASAGGPAALAAILGDLPAHFPASMVAIQHVDAQFAAPMAQWLSGQCPFPVRPVRESERPLPGTVLMPQTNDHLVFTAEQTLHYTQHPRDVSYKPSVDVFFESVAAHAACPVVAVLLTGMGRDGARGLKALRLRGGLTIAQHEAGCVVYGMPKAAIDMGAAVEIIPLPEIATRLVRAVENF